METNFGEIEVKLLLQKVQIYNKKVGQFKSLNVTTNFEYIVGLSNGKITFKFSEMETDKNNMLTPLQLTSIGNRFISNEKTVTTTNKIVKTESGNTGIWQQFMSIFRS